MLIEPIITKYFNNNRALAQQILQAPAESVTTWLEDIIISRLDRIRILYLLLARYLITDDLDPVALMTTSCQIFGNLISFKALLKEHIVKIAPEKHRQLVLTILFDKRIINFTQMIEESQSDPRETANQIPLSLLCHTRIIPYLFQNSTRSRFHNRSERRTVYFDLWLSTCQEQGAWAYITPLFCMPAFIHAYAAHEKSMNILLHPDQLSQIPLRQLLQNKAASQIVTQWFRNEAFRTRLTQHPDFLSLLLTQSQPHHHLPLLVDWLNTRVDQEGLLHCLLEPSFLATILADPALMPCLFSIQHTTM